MKALANLFLSVAILFLGGSAAAGSLDAYFVLVIDLDVGKSMIAKRLVEDCFNGRFPDRLYDCAIHSGGRFELSYLRTRPKSITNSLINSSLSGSLRDLGKIQKVLETTKITNFVMDLIFCWRIG